MLINPGYARTTGSWRDSVRFDYFDQLSDILDTKVNKTVLLTVNRNGMDTSFTTKINGEGQIGFNPYSSIEQLDSLGWAKLEVTKYDFSPLSLPVSK